MIILQHDCGNKLGRSYLRPLPLRERATLGVQQLQLGEGPLHLIET